MEPVPSIDKGFVAQILDSLSISGSGRIWVLDTNIVFDCMYRVSIPWTYAYHNGKVAVYVPNNHFPTTFQLLFVRSFQVCFS